MAKRKIFYKNNYYYFNTSSFFELFTKLRKKDNRNVTQLETKLADTLHVSKESIHSWRFGTCGPGSLELIESLRIFFNLDSVEPLLLSIKTKEDKMKLTDLQLLSLKRIYDSIIDYLYIFNYSDGFNDYWYDLEGSTDVREDKLYEIATKEIDKVILTLKKEYIFLKDFTFYDELRTFIYNDLYDTFDGKLSYAYRFEAIPDNNPTTSDDYFKALNKLDLIIEKII